MNENQKKELLELDLYKLFDLEETCTLEQIKKAYRKKALECHPDKNLDNKEEAEKKFIELGKAFEILTDKSAKAAYDAVRRNRKQRIERLEKLDDKRKKFKEDLEARENQAKSTVFTKTSKNAEEIFKHEIDRLRKEGSKLLEEEMNIINEEIKKKTISKENPKKNDDKPPRFKISWKSTSSDFNNKDLLNHLFSKYGELDIILINSKGTSAIIEYKKLKDAFKLVNDINNLHKKYPFTITWLGPPIKNDDDDDIIEINDTSNNQKDINNHEHSHLSFEEMEAAILKKLQSN